MAEADQADIGPLGGRAAEIANASTDDYQNRQYSPSLGRFGRRDPRLEGDPLFNAYGFPSENSANYGDPLGFGLEVSLRAFMALGDIDTGGKIAGPTFVAGPITFDTAFEGTIKTKRCCDKKTKLGATFIKVSGGFELDAGVGAITGLTSSNKRAGTSSSSVKIGAYNDEWCPDEGFQGVEGSLGGYAAGGAGVGGRINGKIDIDRALFEDFSFDNLKKHAHGDISATFGEWGIRAALTGSVTVGYGFIAGRSTERCCPDCPAKGTPSTSAYTNVVWSPAALPPPWKRDPLDTDLNYIMKYLGQDSTQHAASAYATADTLAEAREAIGRYIREADLARAAQIGQSSVPGQPNTPAPTPSPTPSTQSDASPTPTATPAPSSKPSTDSPLQSLGPGAGPLTIVNISGAKAALKEGTITQSQFNKFMIANGWGADEMVRGPRPVR